MVSLQSYLLPNKIIQLLIKSTETWELQRIRDSVKTIIPIRNCHSNSGMGRFRECIVYYFYEISLDGKICTLEVMKT